MLGSICFVLVIVLSMFDGYYTLINTWPSSSTEGLGTFRWAFFVRVYDLGMHRGNGMGCLLERSQLSFSCA